MTNNRVAGYYDENAKREWERMERHRMEFLVTRKVLSEFLSGTSLKIADIGGGPGRYSIFLAGLGHRVTLVDISREELEIARQKAEEQGVKIDRSLQMNALDLSLLSEAEFDAVLLMGPLYHLQGESDQKEAIREVIRILQPGGLIFASFISRFAPFRDFSAIDPETVFVEGKEWLQMLNDGINFGPGFPGAFFEHPDRIIPLMESCGLETVKMIGVEGVVSGHEDRINQLKGEMLEFWVDLNHRLGSDPACWGCANHLLYIGRKPV